MSYYARINANNEVVETGSGCNQQIPDKIDIDLETYSKINGRVLTHKIFYDFGNNEFKYIVDLDKLRYDLNLAINGWFSSILKSGVEYKDKIYSCESHDQQNLTRLLQMTKTDSCWFKTKNHEDVELTKTEIEELLVKMNEFINRHLRLLNHMKQRIDSAVEENAIADLIERFGK